MKKKLLFVGVAFMALSTMQAQDGVGIGKSIIPDGSAVLDIGATDKGVLFPRVALKGEKDVSVISGGKAANGLLVYNTATVDADIKPGFYFWNGTEWSALMSKTSTVLSETLTSLEISADGVPVVLTYTGENKIPVTLPVAEKLKKDTVFQKYIESLVTSTAAGVKLEKGTGIDIAVTTPAEGETVTTYKISAVPSEIILTGDVEGAANATKIAANAVKSTMIGGGEVKTDNIADKNVTLAKLADGTGANLVLTTGADSRPTWVAQSTIKPTVEDLKTDGIITIAQGTDADKSELAGAVMKAATLSIKDKGITTGKIADNAVTNEKVEDNTLTVDKLATDPSKKNNRLVTDDKGTPVWESKYTTISDKPVATNEVIDGKKVYTVKLSNVVVKEGQVGIGYNTGIESLPKIDNYEYLLRAEVYTDKNKLVVSSVTDIEDANGVIKFRFGMNKMYSTLPAATNYKVVLKYVSTEAVVTP